MKLKIVSLVIFCFITLALDDAGASTYPLSLRYQPGREFPSLHQKFGSTLGIAPFKDNRREQAFIGIHFPVRGLNTYFVSSPSPLENALQKFFSDALSRSGMKVVSISTWDGKPESLKNIDTDSTLWVEIKKFWTEGRGSLFGTNVRTTVQLVIHLGLKPEGKVFTRNAEVEKEVTVPRSTPERVERAVNQILSEILDAFLSSLYDQQSWVEKDKF